MIEESVIKKTWRPPVDDRRQCNKEDVEAAGG